MTADVLHRLTATARRAAHPPDEDCDHPAGVLAAREDGTVVRHGDTLACSSLGRQAGQERPNDAHLDAEAGAGHHRRRWASEASAVWVVGAPQALGVARRVRGPWWATGLGRGRSTREPMRAAA